MVFLQKLQASNNFEVLEFLLISREALLHISNQTLGIEFRQCKDML